MSRSNRKRKTVMRVLGNYTLSDGTTLRELAAEIKTERITQYIARDWKFDDMLRNKRIRRAGKAEIADGINEFENSMYWENMTEDELMEQIENDIKQHHIFEAFRLYSLYGVDYFNCCPCCLEYEYPDELHPEGYLESESYTNRLACLNGMPTASELFDNYAIELIIEDNLSWMNAMDEIRAHEDSLYEESASRCTLDVDGEKEFRRSRYQRRSR